MDFLKQHAQPIDHLIGMTPTNVFKHLFQEPIRCIFVNIEYFPLDSEEVNASVFVVYSHNKQYVCFDYNLELDDPMTENAISWIHNCFIQSKCMTEYRDCQMFTKIYSNLSNVKTSLHFQSGTVKSRWMVFCESYLECA